MATGNLLKGLTASPVSGERFYFMWQCLQVRACPVAKICVCIGACAQCVCASSFVFLLERLFSLACVRKNKADDG